MPASEPPKCGPGMIFFVVLSRAFCSQPSSCHDPSSDTEMGRKRGGVGGRGLTELTYSYPECLRPELTKKRSVTTTHRVLSRIQPSQRAQVEIALARLAATILKIQQMRKARALGRMKALMPIPEQ